MHKAGFTERSAGIFGSKVVCNGKNDGNDVAFRELIVV
jgi:hypothetical protein